MVGEGKRVNMRRGWKEEDGGEGKRVDMRRGWGWEEGGEEMVGGW